MDDPEHHPTLHYDETQDHLGSPIMSLNVDVIREILLSCSSDPARIPLRNGVTAPRCRQPEPRLVLTHVCSSWRAIALRTAELWCDIKIGELETRDVECLETWLERSAQSPLSIYEPPHTRCSLFSVFDDVVFPNLHRCRRLTLGIGHPTALTLLRLPPGSLQSLVGIKLDLLRYKSGPWLQEIARETPITAFQMAHRLRRVELRGSGLYNVMNDPWCLRLPWAQLTVFALRGIDIPADTCLVILRECVALESCTVSLYKNNSVIPPGAPVVVLPALRTFRLKLHPVSHASIINMFHLPALRALHLETTAEWQWPVEMLIPVLAPAARTLRSLCIGRAPFLIYDAPAPGRDPRELLELLPHLTGFFVQTTPRWPRSTLHNLRDGVLGTRLESMCVGEMRARELLDLVEGRLRVARASAGMVSALTFVRAGAESPCRDDPEFARWQALKEAGVTLKFDLDPPSEHERLMNE